MRIVWVLPDLSHYHQARLATLGRRPGLELIVIQVVARGGFAEFAAEPMRSPTFESIVLFQGLAADAIAPARLARRLGQALKVSNADVVFVCGWGLRSANLAQAWALRRGVPVVLAADSTWADRPRRWWRELPKRLPVQAARGGFAAGTASMDYLRRLGMEPRRIRVGYNVVDNAHFAIGAARARAAPAAHRLRARLPESYLLFVGRLVPKKDPLMLLRAFAELVSAPSRRTTELVLVGDGPLRTALCRERDALGLNDRVRLPGFFAYRDLPTLYGLALASVLPSRGDEPWGLVVNESMAAGTPVLISDACGAASDLVRDGETGLRFAPGDVTALAQLLGRVVDDSALRKHLSSNATAHLAAFSLERFADQALELARVAVSAPARPRPLPAAALALLGRVTHYV